MKEKPVKEKPLANIIDPKSENGQQMIRNAAFETPTTQGDPPPEPQGARNYGCKRCGGVHDVSESCGAADRIGWLIRVLREEMAKFNGPHGPTVADWQPWKTRRFMAYTRNLLDALEPPPSNQPTDARRPQPPTFRSEFKAADESIGAIIERLESLAFSAGGKMRKFIPPEDWPFMLAAEITRLKAHRENIQAANRLSEHDSMWVSSHARQPLVTDLKPNAVEWTFTEYGGGHGKAVMVLSESEALHIQDYLASSRSTLDPPKPPAGDDGPDPDGRCLCGHKRGQHGVVKTATCYECECEAFRVDLMAALKSALDPAKPND